MKIALVHDWFVTYAGSEQVVERILAIYPKSDLYTLIDFIPDTDRHGIPHATRTSFLQFMPFIRQKYRIYLPLMPCAIEQFDLRTYDVILSSSHAVAKGVKKNPHQLHICYCHTPIRYAWDLRDHYLALSGLDRGFKGAIAKFILDRMQRWDLSTSTRVDYFIANSHYIADRIRRAYGRDSIVIYPPVDTARFTYRSEKEDFYLTASRMVPYKKIDVIVAAFSSMQDKRLVVVGDGPDFSKIRALAGKNIEFLGYQPSNILRDLMQRAKAFIFAAEEDFGIIPVEAQACGTPIIAFGKGGALETVISFNEKNDHGTGLFFLEQTPAAISEAVQHFEKIRDRFNGHNIREHALRFSSERFEQEFKAFVEAKISERKQRAAK